jgi:type II secretory pathway predicted ATPase ExeA
MTKPEKNFDSVQLMREQRDRISRDIEGMTFEQEKAYIRERLKQAREQPPVPQHEHAAGG